VQEDDQLVGPGECSVAAVLEDLQKIGRVGVPALVAARVERLTETDDTALLVQKDQRGIVEYRLQLLAAVQADVAFQVVLDRNVRFAAGHAALLV